MLRKLPLKRLVLAIGAIAIVAGGAAAIPANAAAQTVDQGTWGNVFSTWSCGSGSTIDSPYSCTYGTSTSFGSNQCHEAGLTPGGGVTVAVSCSISVSVTTQVAPILSAAGKVVGCTSVATTASGVASYASGTGEFGATIPIQTADIHGVNTNSPRVNGVGHLAYHGQFVDTNTDFVYTVDGTIAAAQCAAGSSGSNGNGAGNVVVAFSTQ